MTPKEKATELINKFLRLEDDTSFYWDGYDDRKYLDEDILPHAKKCAIICVDEIINTKLQTIQPLFWEDVKKELESIK